MNERLASRVYPTILYVLDLVDRIHGRKPGGVPDPRDEFPRLKNFLGQLDSDRSSRDDDLAKAALVYWIDEVLINSPWQHANYWKDHTLERELYDSRDRAWEYFEKAKVAKTFPNPDALETFYLGVALGFRGVFRDGQEAPAPQPRPKPTPSAPKAKPAAPPRRAMDSWFGDADPTESDSWDLPPEPAKAAEPPPADDMIDESVFGPPQPAARVGGVDLPGSLDEWAGPVFSQIAPGRQRPFTPQTAADSPRDARPLSGWNACQRSVIALVWTLLTTVILAVVWIAMKFS